MPCRRKKFLRHAGTRWKAELSVEVSLFTREVSISGSFSDNFEDIDDVQSENKLKALLEALEDYIQNFNKDTHDSRSKDSKLKFLKRYRKFLSIN